MRARAISNEIKIGGVAADYIRSVKDMYRPPRIRFRESEKPTCVDASEMLEVLQRVDRPYPEPTIFTVRNLIKRMDAELAGLKVVSFTGSGRDVGDTLFVGAHVYLLGLPRKRWVVQDIYWDYESVRIYDKAGLSQVVPWDRVEFWNER